MPAAHVEALGALSAVCMVMRNLNADLKFGTRFIVDRVSARSVRVIQSCTKARASHTVTSPRVHYIPCIMSKWQIKRNRRSVERRHFPLRPAYAMTCKVAGQDD